MLSERVKYPCGIETYMVYDVVAKPGIYSGYRFYVYKHGVCVAQNKYHSSYKNAYNEMLYHLKLHLKSDMKHLRTGI